MSIDPLSDNFEIVYSPKIEPDTDTDTDSMDTPTPTPTKKINKKVWGHEDTMKLIQSLGNECQELWDAKHPLYKDRAAKLVKQQHLATTFRTTTDEISRKVHNLRSQFNAELRKIKKRRTESAAPAGSVTGGEEEATLPPPAALSRWEYFEPLTFLLPAPSADDKDTFDPSAEMAPGTSYQGETVNLELAEFQVDVEGAYGPAAEANAVAKAKKEEEQKKRKKEPQTHLARILATLARIIENGPPPSPVPLNELLPRRIRTRVNAPDECQVFGDFVASELRMLRTDQARNRLKRVIQTAILQVAKDEEKMIHNLRR